MKYIKFEQPNCVPCKNMGDYLDGKNIEYAKVTPFDDPESAMKYKIRTVPVLVAVDDNGEEVGRTVGFKPSEIDNLLSL